MNENMLLSDYSFYQSLNIIFRMLVLVCCYKLFMYLQLKISMDDNSEGTKVVDNLHNSALVMYFNKYLHENKAVASFLFVLTSGMIDVGGFVVLYAFVFENEYKTNLLLFIGFSLRQLCQALNRLPKPEKLLWFKPSVPSLCVTYDVTNDFFFSGHTYTALVIGIYFLESTNLFVNIYAVFFITTEILFIIVTHSHFWMDIYAAITTYFSLRYFFMLVEGVV